VDAEVLRREGAVRKRLRGHLSSPLTRSGYALIASSIITSVLGFAYWLVAARVFDAEDLGRGAATISGLVLVATIVTSGLKRGLIRFLPVTGPRAGWFVARVYLAAAGATAVLAALFVLGADRWSPDLFGSGAGPLFVVVFSAATAVWAVFVLQDPVLVAARRTWAVPATNGLFSLGKIALLPVVPLVLADRWGIFASWMIPAVITVVLVSGVLIPTTLRSHRPFASADGTEVPLRQMRRFAGAEYVGAIAWLGAVNLLPLLVVARAGAEANASYYLAEQLGYALFLVSSNITDALVAEGARPGAELPGLVRRSSTQIALLMLPGILVLGLFAPQFMGMFGAGYRADGTDVLRLLVLASIPNAVTTVLVAIAHVRRRLGVVVAVQICMSITSCWTMTSRRSPWPGWRASSSRWCWRWR
jgi:O-antigen/teichoic acid export membrane protein